MDFDIYIQRFITSANSNNLKFLMVGGGAVNFHGYQRHSADIDFWVENTNENFAKLVFVLNEIGFEIEALPNEVLTSQQNISLKISPNIDLELITNFNVNKSFSEAYQNSSILEINGLTIMKINVLSLDDLIVSKIKAGRTKDYYDILELKRIHNLP